ncbi:hypothetical protein C5167_014532 [Papaver somniferum]|uniref:Uncharacterized protein n=1 Tax=Papaver somniferum TaxID=3469 RepID=A0A4Y7J3H1_PAPSO|nr:hypothetical protein C5167_014532 [Papaver somniferum]
MVMILIRIILVFKVFVGVETIQETKEIINEMKENDPMRLLNLEVLRIVCRIQTLITQFSRRLKEWENVLGDVGQQFLVGVNVVRASVDKNCIYTGYPYPIVKSAPYRYTVKVFFLSRYSTHTVYVYIDPSFTTECYRNAYSHPIALIPDVKKPNEVNESTKVNAPSVIKGLGRQKKLGIYLVLRSQGINGCMVAVKSQLFTTRDIQILLVKLQSQLVEEEDMDWENTLAYK